MKILVVGASGFIGRALVDRLAHAGHRVDAWDRRGGTPIDGVQRWMVDLTAHTPLPIPEHPWDAAFHLAGHTLPSAAWTHQLVLENVAMTARVFEHLAEHAPGCLAVLASSGFVYAPGREPHTEVSPVSARRPYGLSKQLSEVWALSLQDRLRVQIVRAFNQIGPGMAKGLLVPDLLDALARDEAVLTMKGRDDWKDFLDWRDAMDAYLALLDGPGPSGSVWNLCSGRRTRVSSLIHSILAERGLDREVRFADARVESLLGNPTRLMQATGWTPRRSLQETARAICATLIAGPTGHTR